MASRDELRHPSDVSDSIAASRMQLESASTDALLLRGTHTLQPKPCIDICVAITSLVLIETEFHFRNFLDFFHSTSSWHCYNLICVCATSERR